MFAPVPGTRIIAPSEKQAKGEIVNDRYFEQGATLEHAHETYHFQGPPRRSRNLAQKLLGVSLHDVQNETLEIVLRSG